MGSQPARACSAALGDGGVRYRFLVPLMLATVLLEQALRIAIGMLKPLQVAAAPPGASGSLFLLPLSAVAFVLSLRCRE